MVSQNILVIIGHPSTKSLSHKLAAEYVQAARQAGHTVQVVDTYNLKPDLPLVTYQDFSEWDQDNKAREEHQKLIASADKLVFFHPVWWGSLPAALKNYIDQTLKGDFAFTYQSRWWLPDILNIKPKGLLKDKRAHVFITYDSYSLVYAFLLFPFINVWALFVFFYCGIWRMRFTLHQRVRWASDTKREKWLKRAAKLGAKS